MKSCNNNKKSEGWKPSNENSEFSVPETEFTVIVPVEIRLTVAADMLHSTDVPLVHADVAQSTDDTVAVGVRSTEAKARPLRVAIAPPEVGAFFTPTLAKLTAGAADFIGGKVSVRK